MSLISTSLKTATRPRLACELAPEAIFAAQSAGMSDPLQNAVCVLLPADVMAPGWKSPLLVQREPMQAALTRALQGMAGRNRPLTLVIPDACVRVMVLDFETLSNKPSEALPLVRFRLRKMLPFDVDTAAVTYQVLRTNREVEKVGSLRVMVAATSAEIRDELELFVREAGFEPGAILPATVAALAAVPETGAHLVVHTGQRSVTTAITDAGDLLLYRTVERIERPGHVESTEHFDAAEDDMVQAILMATAFYEDALGRLPEQILVAGQDTPEQVQQRLHAEGTLQIPLRSLTRTEHFLAEATPNGYPACGFAGVVGALHG